jgi:hypothetical protein
MRNSLAPLLILLVLSATAAAQSAKEKPALTQQACKDIGGDELHNGLECKGKSLSKILRQIHFEQIDLNGDGVAEYQLSTSMETIKSVNIVIYQKAPQGYRLLFSGISRGLEVKKTKTNGYYDLLETDAGVGPLYRLYKYDGKKYKES